MSLFERWSRPAGYREVLQLALPLVLSTSSWTIQNFVDRMFLSQYSPLAMAAALPAGMLAYSLICFFLGTASYANTFVAQYKGVGQSRRIGPAIWQAIYFSMLTGLLLPVVLPLSGAIFGLAGHEPKLMALELTFFRIMMLGSVFTVYTSALSCFFTGQGRNWPVLWVNFAGMLVNIILDYALIFGHWGFPEWGIAGAAWATVTAQAFGALAFTILVFNARHEREFAIRSGWRLDRALFARLMRFGAPSGVQFTLDMMGFTLFTFMVGRIGTIELAATNVALQINTLAFMPMIGFGMATSTLVGQYLGRNKPDLASRATWSTFHVTLTYMTAISVFYVLFPSWFIDPFATRTGDVAMFNEERRIAMVILKFVAVYSIFDTLNIVFASALKGAGDTRFVMFMSVFLGWTIMVLPTWWVCTYGHGGVYWAWTFFSLFVIVVGFGFLLRFLNGKWRSMRVIENQHMASQIHVPDMPTVDVDL